MDRAVGELSVFESTRLGGGQRSLGGGQRSEARQCGVVERPSIGKPAGTGCLGEVRAEGVILMGDEARHGVLED